MAGYSKENATQHCRMLVFLNAGFRRSVNMFCLGFPITTYFIKKIIMRKIRFKHENLSLITKRLLTLPWPSYSQPRNKFWQFVQQLTMTAYLKKIKKQEKERKKDKETIWLKTREPGTDHQLGALSMQLTLRLDAGFSIVTDYNRKKKHQFKKA